MHQKTHSNNTQIPLLSQQKQQLRRQLTAQRKQLTHKQLSDYRLAIKRQICRCMPVMSARRIGIYYPVNGEVATNMIAEICPRAELFIPKVLHYKRRIMCFTPTKNTRKMINKWGITETATINRAIWARQLDVLIMPLVAFDKHGNRLGMGGGFYDAALSNHITPKNTHRPRPRLVGLAYDFQEVKQLPTQDWDIPLDIVVTNQQVIYN